MPHIPWMRTPLKHNRFEWTRLVIDMSWTVNCHVCSRQRSRSCAAKKRCHLVGSELEAAYGFFVEDMFLVSRSVHTMETAVTRNEGNTSHQQILEDFSALFFPVCVSPLHASIGSEGNGSVPDRLDPLDRIIRIGRAPSTRSKDCDMSREASPSNRSDMFQTMFFSSLGRAAEIAVWRSVRRPHDVCTCALLDSRCGASHRSFLSLASSWGASPPRSLL